VDGLIVEVRNGENAGKARFKHSIALRQFVNLQNSPDPRHSAVASDKCVVFVSFDGAYACVARENQRKYHPNLRCIAVAWEVRRCSCDGIVTGCEVFRIALKVDAEAQKSGLAVFDLVDIVDALNFPA